MSEPTVNFPDGVSTVSTSELAALRADAERWRTVREAYVSGYSFVDAIKAAYEAAVIAAKKGTGDA